MKDAWKSTTANWYSEAAVSETERGGGGNSVHWGLSFIVHSCQQLVCVWCSAYCWTGCCGQVVNLCISSEMKVLYS